VVGSSSLVEVLPWYRLLGRDKGSFIPFSLILYVFVSSFFVYFYAEESLNLSLFARFITIVFR
jgi:hypothetical protein